MAELRLIERAQQGDPQAIADLMNQSLQPKGMTAMVERQGDALEVTLEADRVPNRQALTAFVEKGIHNLGIESIRSIRILGQQTGASFPAWMQELYLEVSPVNTLANAPIDGNPAAHLSEPATASDLQTAELSSFSEENRADLQTELESIWDEQAQDQSQDFLQDLLPDNSDNFDDSDNFSNLEIAGLEPGLDLTSADSATPDALSDLNSLQDLFTEESLADLDLNQPSVEAGQANSLDSFVADPWSDGSQLDSSPNLSLDLSFEDLSIDRPDAVLDSSANESSNGLLDDLFAESPTNPATTDEMGFEAAAVPLTSVDDLLAVLDDEEEIKSSSELNSEPAVDLFRDDEPQDQFALSPDLPDELIEMPEASETDALADLFIADAPETDTVAADMAGLEDNLEDNLEEPLFTEEIIFVEEPIDFDFSDDSPEEDTSDEDAPAAESDELGFLEDAPVLEEREDNLAIDESGLPLDFSRMSDENLFAVATDPLDVDNLNFGISASEALDANLLETESSADLLFGTSSDENSPDKNSLDEPNFDQLSSDRLSFDESSSDPLSSNALSFEPGSDLSSDLNFELNSEPDFELNSFEPDAESSLELNSFELNSFEPDAEPGLELNSFELNSFELNSEPNELLDVMAAEAEMSPEVVLRDQWLESTSAEELAPGEFAASEQDVFAQEFPDAPELTDLPADFLVEEIPAESAESIEEPAADAASDWSELDFQAEMSEASEPESGDREINLDLSGWFADQIEPGDPAAELSTSPSEDFLSREDLPDFGSSDFGTSDFATNEEAETDAAADALFNDVPPEPTFTPESNLLEELVLEHPSEAAEELALGQAAPEDTSAEELPLADLELQTTQPEITQQQLEAQIENLFAEESDSVNEDSFQNSWELSEDVSDDSADAEDWSNAVNFSLDEPSEAGETSDFDAAPTDFPPAPEPDFLDLNVAPELTIDEPGIDELAIDEPGIDEQPDDQTIEASNFAADDFSGLDFLSEMPGIDLPDDQSIPASADLFASEVISEDGDYLPESSQEDLQEDPAADEFADVSLASTLSLSDAIESDFDSPQFDSPQFENSQEDLQDNLDLSLDFQDSPETQESLADLAALEEPPLPQELTDEQLQELLGSQSEDFSSEPTPEAPPQQEPLLDFLNRQFGLEEEMPTVEELPELPEQSAQLDDREDLLASEFISGPATFLQDPQPTQIPFAAVSSEAPLPEPDLSLDLPDAWLTEPSSTAPAADANLSLDNAELPERQEQSQEDLERQLESSGFVFLPDNEAYSPAEGSPAAPSRDTASAAPSRSRSASNGLFTLILFSIVGFIAALLGFSLWSEISAPPEPEPQPVPASPAPPAPPAVPPAASPAAPPVQAAPPAASPVAPPADAPVAPPPEAAPVPPAAPVAPPAAPPASP